MQAIELNTRTDKKGRLKIDHYTNLHDKKVRILILSAEKSDNDEVVWDNSFLNNPAFEFLKSPEEDIYSINDGQEISD
jgi:hypothetical protein